MFVVCVFCVCGMGGACLRVFVFVFDCDLSEDVGEYVYRATTASRLFPEVKDAFCGMMLKESHPDKFMGRSPDL